MRKFTLFLLAVCFVLTAGAAPTGPRKDVKLPAAMTQRLQHFTSKQHRQPQRFNAQQQHASDMRTLRALQQRTTASGTAAQRAPRLAAAIITSRPEGDYKLYERNGDSYVGTMFGVYYNQCLGGLCEVVFGSDGKVYLKNIISQIAVPGWIEGTLSGSTITFTLPQVVESYGGGEDYYASLMAYDAAEQTYNSVEGTQTLTLSYDAATGTISSGDDLADGDLVVGVADMDGYWVGYADWNFSMTPVTDEPLEAPEGLQTDMFIVQADGFPGCVANVGFQGSDVWVQGIYPAMPEAWVKGTINGDKAVFKNKQFLGADFQNIKVQYLVTATAEETFVEDPEWGDYTETYYYLSDVDITFDYDAATKTFTGTNLFVVNAGLQEVSYANIYENTVIKPFVETAATPMAPSNVTLYEEGYQSYQMGYGWGVIEFDQYTNDEDGNYILPDKLSYQLWIRVNGEEMPLVLHTYDYQNLDEDMVELPYDFTDNWDISAENSYHYAYYYVVGPEAYGVQAIYRGQGEERRSEIVWADAYDLGSELQPEAATPDYPDVDPQDVGSSISYGSYTGNESRVTFGEWKPQTYDVAIRLQEEALVGTYIEDVTLNLRTVSGVSNLKVWLTSQLREEDGQNAPDLISVDADMPAKAGNVTVKLPKPYIIPEEGVYVGYSFTVSEDAYSRTNKPVTIVDQVKPFGFYIHSTACFLKWLELSELVGGSACINVTFGGSLVKKNAVAPAEGDKIYVLTGSDISVSVPFVNHGSEGITSLDLEYTFNGTTATEHVDLSNPVKGFFGQTYNHSFSLPAVSEKGTYDLVVKVLKVNGVDNEEPQAEAATPVFVINTMPRHRSLLEEYTGTWCGWCPRGFVALELLKEQYPDDFVCVSYHNSDPMEITTVFPSPVSGFPSAFVDRGIEVDPYSGLEEDGFHIVDVLQWRNTMFGVADLDVKATLAGDNSTVDVVADVTFPFSDDAADYSMEYILVEDGLTGEGSDWVQANYYSDGESGEMGGFEAKEDYVSGLVFNDVAVMQSEMGGISESIPAAVEADQPVQHQYSFDLEMAVNSSWEPIIQDYEKLYVVALIIDNATGTVANAIKVPVTSATVGIENVDAKQRRGSQTVYDLMGRRVAQPQKGIYIRNGRKVVK